MKGFSLPQRQFSFAAKITALALLSLGPIAGLAGASWRLAERTEDAARQLHGDGLPTAWSAARLSVLLERHRMTVEHAAAETSAPRLGQAEQQLAALDGRLRAVLMTEPVSGGPALAASLDRDLPALLESGHRAVQLAQQLRTAEAEAVASGPYAHTAERIEATARAWRDAQLHAADGRADELVRRAGATIKGVGFSTLSAVGFLLIILIGMRRVLTRLDRVCAAMHRLAHGDLAVEVPSRGDEDEVGRMARAIEVFKANAAAVAERDAQLEQANLHLDAALDNMPQGLTLFDAAGRLIICNHRYAEIYGLAREQVQPGMTLRDIVALRYAGGEAPDMEMEDYLAWRGLLSHLDGPVDTVVELRSGRVVSIHRRAMPDGGWVATHEDITERRRTEARITHMARHDALTGLPNRTLFHDRLEAALRGLGRGGAFAVLCLDLDQFKAVNDTLGHAVGDGLLRAVAERLCACVREVDTVARLGGDEFAVLQAEVTRPQDATMLASRIVEAIAAPYEIDGHHIVAGASVGIALAPADGAEAGRLMKGADMALYRAKADGRGTWRFFEAAMDSRLQARRAMELDLRKAIVTGEFAVYYQPLVNLGSNRVTGFEALVRWQHPARGIITPAEFIPLAEETGLVVQLGEWVLRTACLEAAAWPQGVRVAVNLSPVQFRRGLSQAVASALEESGLPPERLELEITESVLLHDDDATLATLHEIRALGVRVSLDDFGTGCSSLSHLRRFPFDKIKIDKSFVQDMADQGAIAVVRAVAGLGSSLGVATTAEGVETAGQLARLRVEGCTEVQGYLFSPPRPGAEVPGLIRQLNGPDRGATDGVDADAADAALA